MQTSSLSNITHDIGRRAFLVRQHIEATQGRLDAMEIKNGTSKELADIRDMINRLSVAHSLLETVIGGGA